jgi:5-methylcytosine-specific restriction endonuclease McrA
MKDHQKSLNIALNPIAKEFKPFKTNEIVHHKIKHKNIVRKNNNRVDILEYIESSHKNKNKSKDDNLIYPYFFEIRKHINNLFNKTKTPTIKDTNTNNNIVTNYNN